MYIPSYDFRIFDLPLFSPLQAQEFGAATSFNANTPTSYIDYSLNQFSGLLNPSADNPYSQRQFPTPIGRYDFEDYFQDTPQAARERLRKLRDQANEVLGETQADLSKALPSTKKTTDECPPGYSPVSVFGLFSYCGKKLHSDDTGAMGEKGDATGLGNVEKVMNALPAGSGIFLIAVIIIILLFLFVKR
jgi:hypothetical protein